MTSEWLFDRLQEFEQTPALIWLGASYTYGHLLEACRNWQQLLQEKEIRPGEVVALCGDFSKGTVALFLALLANQNTIVPQMAEGLAERQSALETACVSAIFEFDQADGWHLSRRTPAGSHPLLQKLSQQGEAGLILFSSGSTGDPKAALHSLPRMLNKFSQKRFSGYRTLTFLRLEHIGGINVFLSALCNGGTLIPIRERSAEATCRAIAEHQVALLPTTPTFLNMLLISRAYERYDLSSLKIITHGSEPMPPATIRALQTALPHVHLKQAYGLTELGVLSTHSHKNDSQWLKIGGEQVEMKVVDDTLWIRTDFAMQGYLNFPSPFDDEGWFNTGDTVVVQDGYMRILGRASEIINVGGEKVFPAEVEDVILQMENIREVAVHGMGNPVMGNLVVARVELIQPEDADDLEDRVRAYCRTRLASYKIPAVVQIAAGTVYGGRFKKMRGNSPLAAHSSQD